MTLVASSCPARVMAWASSLSSAAGQGVVRGVEKGDGGDAGGIGFGRDVAGGEGVAHGVGLC